MKYQARKGSYYAGLRHFDRLDGGAFERVQTSLRYGPHTFSSVFGN
jgi:hypothetical protein